jgi:hypothetical protein
VKRVSDEVRPSLCWLPPPWLDQPTHLHGVLGGLCLLLADRRTGEERTSVAGKRREHYDISIPAREGRRQVTKTVVSKVVANLATEDVSAFLHRSRIWRILHEEQSCNKDYELSYADTGLTPTCCGSRFLRREKIREPRNWPRFEAAHSLDTSWTVNLRIMIKRRRVCLKPCAERARANGQPSPSVPQHVAHVKTAAPHRPAFLT